MKKLILGCLLLGAGLVTGSEKVVGVWEGTLDSGAQKMRLILKVEVSEAGKLGGTVTSVDQGNVVMPIDRMVFKGGRFSYEIDAISGSYTAKLSKDGTVLKGTWKQGPSELPLDMKRKPEGQ